MPYNDDMSRVTAINTMLFVRPSILINLYGRRGRSVQELIGVSSGNEDDLILR